jgi:acyl carrier protein
MDTLNTLLGMIDDVLGLKGKAMEFTIASKLLGAVPGLDSMAVLALIERIESHFDITVDDAEMDGSLFASVGTLHDFVTRRLTS